MPHNLYLHSALVQTRKISNDDVGIKKALKYNFIDSTIALNAAFFVNAAILVLAATVFYKTGHSDVAKIEDAHQLLAPMLGTKLAPILFAVALIAAGQSSTVTGTLAGTNCNGRLFENKDQSMDQEIDHTNDRDHSRSVGHLNLW
jgi:manganese transport protein